MFNIQKKTDPRCNSMSKKKEKKEQKRDIEISFLFSSPLPLFSFYTLSCHQNFSWVRITKIDCDTYVLLIYCLCRCMMLIWYFLFG